MLLLLDRSEEHAKGGGTTPATPAQRSCYSGRQTFAKFWYMQALQEELSLAAVSLLWQSLPL